jgi:hypothetical protein
MTETPLPLALRPFEALGRRAIDIVLSLGRFGTFLGEALLTMFTTPLKVGAFLGRVHLSASSRWSPS